jgi:DnaK suppressor protein
MLRSGIWGSTPMKDRTTRNALLRTILLDRRRTLQEDVDRRIRDGRADRPGDVRDELEHSSAIISEDVAFALLELKGETLRRIDGALGRLEINEYGYCFECAVEIAETRLRALPFAVRCTSCEARREQGQALTQKIARQHASFSLFPEPVSS